jgi:hypothetical protein
MSFIRGVSSPIEKAYFRATYAVGTAGIAIGTANWELVELNETAHSASPAPSFAAIAASPYTADGSVIIYDAGTYDFDYRIGINTGATTGGWGKSRIRQADWIPLTVSWDTAATMPYSQGIPLVATHSVGGGHSFAMQSVKEIGTRCRQEITGITKVQIEAWVSIAGSVIGSDVGSAAADEPAVFAWLTVTKVL